MSESKYIADLYLRISKEDGDKEESDSINNQRAFLLDYIKTIPNIILHNIQIDDGYSGIDFNRPGFLEMMEDIKNGTINCVIVKDFSRFGRNYIESGKYIQVLFPRMGVRFIAINDFYDSTKVQGYTNNIIVPFKNLLNDFYCADISSKVRSHLEIKRKNGDFVGAFAMYGYKKDTCNHNKLVIDRFAADVVCDIFRWTMEGLSASSIAVLLNQTGIHSPLEYKRFHGIKYSSNFKIHVTSKWTAKAVIRILMNAVYTGKLEQGKRTRPNYKIRVLSDVPKEQWICCEHAHEPIIDTITFEIVQKLMEQSIQTPKQGSFVYPLSGIILCGDCGSPMIRKKTYKENTLYSYYVCSKHRSNKDTCSTHNISCNKCEHAVQIALRSYISSTLNIEKALIYMKHQDIFQINLDKLTSRLGVKQHELQKYTNFQQSLYENYLEHMISKEDFINFQANYDQKITDIKYNINTLTKEIEQLSANHAEFPSPSNRLLAFANLQTMNRSIIVRFIESVKVYEDNKLEITFRFQDEYERIKEGI